MSRLLKIAECVLLIVLFACTEDRLVPAGFLYLNVEEDATLITKAQSEVTFESLRVDVLDMDGDTVKTYPDYLTDVKGKRLTFPVGNYTVAVSSNHDGKAAWNAPLFQGAEEIVVKQGEITSAQVVCKIANTKVSVNYSEEMGNYFSHFGTTISNTSGSLTYTRDEYRSGYFTPEPLTVVLRLVNRDGNEFIIRKIYNDINPQYHYTFKFTVANSGDDGEAGADFDITVDDTHKEICYDICIREENLFGIGEPKAVTMGKFVDGAFSYRVNSALPEVGTIGLLLKLGAKCSLSSVLVETTSPTFAKAGLNKFDLMRSQEAVLAKELGLVLPDFENGEKADSYSTYDWDLSGLVPHLECLNLKPTEHPFTMTLVDDRNQETAVSFIIKVVPDVKVAVEEPYCWSSFALLKGLSQNKDVYFRLTKEDGEPIDIRDVKITDDGNVSALVIGLEPEVTYSYTLASDADPEMKCDPVEFQLRVSDVVYNIGFEEWGTRSKKAVIGSGNATFVVPNGGTSGNVVWDSGNWGAKAAGETLTDKTTETATASSTFGAQLSSKWAGALGFGAFSAGSIFTGEAQTVSSKGATLKYGYDYYGYPTHMKGFYKYTPGIIDYQGEFTPANGLKIGDTDECLIYVALCTKMVDVVSMTSGVNPFDPNADYVFAYGEYISKTTENKTGETLETTPLNEYEPFDICLKYKTDVPKTSSFYIVIVATSSRYGDYFTGSTNSVLCVDEFELTYDYDAQSFVDRSLGGMTPVNINEKKE